MTRSAFFACALTAGVLSAACATKTPEMAPIIVDPPETVEPPPPSAPPPEARAAGKLDRALWALQEPNYDAVFGHLLSVVDLCGRAPLGQQALLLMAVAELDPRNPDPRLNVATQSLTALLEAESADAWTTALAESLYLVSLQLGARNAGLEDPDVAEIEFRVQQAGAADSSRDGGRRVDEYCGARLQAAKAGDPAADALEPAAEAGDSPGSLPTLGRPPYPVQIAELRRQVGQLQEEVDRLRRIVSQ